MTESGALFFHQEPEDDLADDQRHEDWRFDQVVHKTFFGRAQAIIHSGTEAGQVKVTVSAEGLERKDVILRVHEG